MDNMRRQQLLQQQQLQRQQQQQLFQRQQEQFRRQQQEHLRRQQQLQQDHLRRQEQQRQQELLRNVQRSSAIGGGNTVVHVVPGFTFEVSGIHPAGGLHVSGSERVEISANRTQMSAEGVIAGETIPNTQPQAPPPPNPSFQPVPPTGPGAPVGPPPPYTTSTPPATQPHPPTAQAPPPPSTPIPDNRVILKDGTQIIIHQEDEILFIGPSGIQMVVNCLPLYEPPDEEVELNTDRTPGSLSLSLDTGIIQGKSGHSKLLKARSMGSITSSQLGDDDGDHEAKTVGVVATPPRRKSSKHSHYSVTVHSVPVSNGSAATQPKANEESKKHDEGQQTVEGEATQKSQEDAVPQSNGDIGAVESVGDVDKAEHSAVRSTDESVHSSASGGPDAAVERPGVVQEGSEHSANTENGACSAAHSITNESNGTKQEETEPSNRDLVRNGADGAGEAERQEGESCHELSKEVESKPEAVDVVNGGESDPQKHTKLQKTRSERTSVSPDGDLSDSEDNGFSVNYIQDPCVVPQLKRSSGSVSFYAPNGHTVGASEATAENSTHNVGTETLLELSCENKLDVTSLEKNEVTSTTADKEDEANGEGEPEGREKSLSTAKPSILVETDSILQQSASGNPTAPAQTPLSPTISASPLSLEATARASPTSSRQPTIWATPLPVPPVTLDKDYVERSGWLNKLSHRKGMFGDKWQKRYFVLHRSWLYYFKKYGDSNPRGVIRLLPTSWCRFIPQGTRRMSDAVINKTEQASAIISVLRCFAVHRPNNFAASLSDLLGAEGVAEAFRSQTVSISNAQHMSRTFYMIAPSNEEKDAWIATINNNIKAYAHSGEALDTSCKELKKMLRAVQCNIAQKDIPSVLLLLTLKMKKVVKHESNMCSGSS